MEAGGECLTQGRGIPSRAVPLARRVAYSSIVQQKLPIAPHDSRSKDVATEAAHSVSVREVETVPRGRTGLTSRTQSRERRVLGCGGEGARGV